MQLPVDLIYRMHSSSGAQSKTSVLLLQCFLQEKGCDSLAADAESEQAVDTRDKSVHEWEKSKISCVADLALWNIIYRAVTFRALKVVAT